MKNQIQVKQPKLSIGAILCAAILVGCSHSHSPSNNIVETSIDAAPPASEEVAIATADKAIYEEVSTAKQSTLKLMQRAVNTRQLVKTGSAVIARQSVRIESPTPIELHRDRYASIESNPVKRASEDPISTFSLDVDTGSYSVVRRHLQQGQMPPADAVRVEELINYFNYNTAAVKDPDHPFAFKTELADSPWHKHRHLLRVSVAAWQQPMEKLPPSNLVFLVDVSGSMHSANKLPLLKASLKLLVNQMRPEDTVSLVTYAGSSSVVLQPTKGSEKLRISNAIDSLGAGGGTHGAAGLKDAYRLASEHKISNGVNRVILATDGDFNVGLSDTESLLNYIKEQRQLGISLTTLGFGQGNYNDHLMEQLADQGNGNHAYIDTLSEARKVLMDQVGATLYTVASDAKVQVEFNPAQVSEYRLIGYENRLLKDQDFDNDKVDAGDIGAGHSITALYEIALNGSEGERLPKRRYAAGESKATSHNDELAWVKLRYKPNGSHVSSLLEQKIKTADMAEASPDFQFASSVAAWGDWLRQPTGDSAFSIRDIIELAESSQGEDQHGYRSEYIQLLKLSAAMRPNQNPELAKN